METTRPRRWTGTRWVDYAPDQPAPDEHPLLDFERRPTDTPQNAQGFGRPPQ